MRASIFQSIAISPSVSSTRKKRSIAIKHEAIVPRLVPGGLLVADNAISHQAELAPMLDRATSDDRVDAVVVPIGRGELVCRKTAVTSAAQANFRPDCAVVTGWQSRNSASPSGTSEFPLREHTGRRGATGFVSCPNDCRSHRPASVIAVSSTFRSFRVGRCVLQSPQSGVSDLRPTKNQGSEAWERRETLKSGVRDFCFAEIEPAEFGKSLDLLEGADAGDASAAQ